MVIYANEIRAFGFGVKTRRNIQTTHKQRRNANKQEAILQTNQQTYTDTFMQMVIKETARHSTNFVCVP